MRSVLRLNSISLPGVKVYLYEWTFISGDFASISNVISFTSLPSDTFMFADLTVLNPWCENVIVYVPGFTSSRRNEPSWKLTLEYIYRPSAATFIFTAGESIPLIFSFPDIAAGLYITIWSLNDSPSRIWLRFALSVIYPGLLNVTR